MTTRSKAYFISMKSALGLAYLALIGLTITVLWHGLTPAVLRSILVLSVVWMALTLLQLKALFKSWFRLQSRLRVRLPMVANGLLCAVCALLGPSLIDQALALVQVPVWILIWYWERRNAKKFHRFNGAISPVDMWHSPQAEAIPPFAFLISRGQFLPKFHIHREGGHAEFTYLGDDGMMMSFSCYMDQGVVTHLLSEVCRLLQATNESYIVCKPKVPPTEEKLRKGPAVAKEMLEEDIVWRDTANQRITKLVGMLPIPATWKSALEAKLHCTGYGWRAFFFAPAGGLIGRLRWLLSWVGLGWLLPDWLVPDLDSPRMWSCISACADYCMRVDMPTDEFGHGLTFLGLWNPIMPDDPLADRNYEYMTLADKAAFEQRSKAIV